MSKPLIILALAIITFLFVAIFYIMSDIMDVKSIQSELNSKQVFLERQNLVSKVETEASIKLSNRMSYLQLYMEKLALSGQAKNWPLASYYAGLVRQELTAIQKMDAVHDGRTINTFLEGTSLKLIGNLEKNAAGPLEGFKSSYKQFVRSCNACHESTGTGYIKIKVPKGDPFVGQTFSPEKD